MIVQVIILAIPSQLRKPEIDLGKLSYTFCISTKEYQTIRDTVPRGRWGPW